MSICWLVDLQSAGFPKCGCRSFVSSIALVGCNSRCARFVARLFVHFIGMNAFPMRECIARAGDCVTKKIIRIMGDFTSALMMRIYLHVRGQCGHLNGFSPVCWLRWNFRSWFRLKFLLQMPHWCGRVLLCEISCCFNVEFDG